MRLNWYVSVYFVTAIGTSTLLTEPATAQSLEDLQHLSIEDLGNIEISSVSKKPEPLSDAAAAVFVITHDEIMRSGATSIPEMLRLAPNLQVAQVSASSYAISARGFNGTLANKLLVLIDGRSVYTPLFGGVYWDMQDVLPENVERIEVISGPGATLWGANAVNGVINIITRKSGETAGGVIDLGVGNLERSIGVQYGGTLAQDLTYRVYAKAFDDSALVHSDGTGAHDGRAQPQGGFRLDWSPSGDLVTLQGDISRGVEQQYKTADQTTAGDNILSRWQHSFADGSQLQVQAYFDDTRRFADNGGGGLVLNTYDFDTQYSFALGDWNNIVVGGGERISNYRITGIPQLFFNPASRTLNLGNVFAQDNISLTNAVKLVLGLKLENDPYSGLAPLPNARISWKIDNTDLVWAAVSRAVRSPTPFDRDLVEKQGPTVFLTGGPDFQAEKLTAYEIGYRGEPFARLSVSLSAFYNNYDDLRSIEPAPTGLIFPLVFGNMMEGDSYGVEAWATYRATDWWRISAGVNWLRENLRFKAGSSQLGGIAQAGDDPRYQFSVRTSFDLSNDVTFDADLRGVGALPNPAVPAYVEFDARIAWKVTEFVEISIDGSNLLHDHHLEFANPPITDKVERSFFVDTRWKF